MAWQEPRTNWGAGNIPTGEDFNRIEGNINYIEEESRTPSDTATPAASGKLSLLLNYIVSMIKAITGKANWYTAPDTTLAAAKAHADLTTTAHGGITPSSHVGSGGSAHAVVTTSVAGFMSAADKTKLNGIEAGATADMTASEILTALKTVDGAGSGLDADTLRGLTPEQINVAKKVVDRDYLGNVIYSDSPLGQNNNETGYIYTTAWMDTGKDINLNLTADVHFLRMDLECVQYKDTAGFVHKVRIQNNADANEYIEYQLNEGGGTYGNSPWNTAYKWLSYNLHLRKSTLYNAGNVTCSIYMSYSSDNASQWIKNRGFDLHANSLSEA